MAASEPWAPGPVPSGRLLPLVRREHHGAVYAPVLRRTVPDGPVASREDSIASTYNSPRRLNQILSTRALGTLDNVFQGSIMVGRGRNGNWRD